MPIVAARLGNGDRRLALFALGDRVVTREIFEIVRGINDEGITVLLVEQNARLALGIAQFGYVLESGTVALADTSESLRQNEDVRRSYLGY